MDKIIINISDSPLSKNSSEEKWNEMYEEIYGIVSYEVAIGNVETNKEQNLFICTKYGAAAITLIPKVQFQ